jgi:hypothetical protein
MNDPSMGFPGYNPSRSAFSQTSSRSLTSFILDILRSRILTNILLLLVVFFLMAITAFAAVGLAYLYNNVDFVAISDTFVEAKDVIGRGQSGYDKMRNSIPFNVSVVLEKIWPKTDHEAEKTTDHILEGVYGAASVLTDMDEIKFIQKITPLLEKLAEASVTTAAKEGSEGFGRVFKFLGKAVDDREQQLNLDLWHNIAGKLLLIVSNNQTIPTVESLERTVKHIATSGVFERGVESVVTLSEHVASIEFDGKEVGRSVTVGANSFSQIMQDYNHANATHQLLHSLEIISSFMNDLGGAGINIGFGNTVAIKKI